MNTQEALSIINQVAAAYRGTPQDHVNIRQAITVLTEAVVNAESNCTQEPNEKHSDINTDDSAPDPTDG